MTEELRQLWGVDAGRSDKQFVLGPFDEAACHDLNDLGLCGLA